MQINNKNTNIRAIGNLYPIVFIQTGFQKRMKNNQKET